MFAQGMQLVEESAGFLDGPGRDAVKQLDRNASIEYGTQSMRLTTRLMQLASWLLLQRAANEGEMNRAQILEEKEKIKLDTLPENLQSQDLSSLPQQFVSLVEQSIALQERVLHLDAELYGDLSDAAGEKNPVNDQIELLSTALGAKKFG